MPEIKPKRLVLGLKTSREACYHRRNGLAPVPIMIFTFALVA